MAHEAESPKIQLQFLLTTMWQYWLCTTKPKYISFQINLKHFHQVNMEFKFFYLTEFSAD